MILKSVSHLNFFSNGEKVLIDSIFDFEENKLYQITVNKIYDVKLIDAKVLTNENVYLGESKFPENALQINLLRGNYIIVYDKNIQIFTSVGTPNFNENCFEFKMTKNSNLYVWQSSNNETEIKIYKISKNKNPIVHSQTFFKKNDESFIYFKNLSYYEIIINEVIEDLEYKILEKYPHGTYDIVFHKNISTFNNDFEIKSIIKRDSENFEIENGKIKTLKNIEIPDNVNPLNHYCFIGKLNLMIYIDFNNDTYYINPICPAEVYANLFIPNKIVEEIENEEDHAIVHVVDYQLLSHNYMNHNDNLNVIKKWIKCDDMTIHHKNELFYYIDNFNLNEWYYEKYKDIIEKYFMYIKLYDIEAEIIDNLEEKIDSNDKILDYIVIKCKWMIGNKNEYVENKIKWNYDFKWENIDNQINKIHKIITGEGTILVSKRHFMNMTNSIDINEHINGEFGNSVFKSLNLNSPTVNPFERFQYWTQFRLPFEK